MTRYSGVVGTRSTAAQKAARREVIVKLARQGVATKDIARQVPGSSISEVQRVRREEGISNGIRRPLSPEQIERARLLMLDGASRKEAARSVGGTAEQLRHALPDLHGWDVATRVEAEHATGQRAKTSPVIEGSSSKPWRYPEPAPLRAEPEGFLPDRPAEGPFA